MGRRLGLLVLIGSGACSNAPPSGGFDAGSSCNELQQSYAQAFPGSLACRATDTGPRCQFKRERVLGCGCYQFVEDAKALDAIVALWTARGCSPPACPAVFCADPDAGVCTNARCESVL